MATAYCSGIDIFALKNEGFGNVLTIIDCKKYSEANPVGNSAVRGMYGTLQIESVSHGIIATIPRFTRGTNTLAHDYKYQLLLKDHAGILRWIQKISGTKKRGQCLRYPHKKAIKNNDLGIKIIR